MPSHNAQRDEMPHLEVAERREQRQHDRLREQQRLRDEQRPAPVDAVGDHAGERPEHQDADVRAERDDAEQQRGTR